MNATGAAETLWVHGGGWGVWLPCASTDLLREQQAATAKVTAEWQWPEPWASPAAMSAWVRRTQVSLGQQQPCGSSGLGAKRQEKAEYGKVRTGMWRLLVLGPSWEAKTGPRGHETALRVAGLWAPTAPGESGWTVNQLRTHLKKGWWNLKRVNALIFQGGPS